MHHDLPHDAPYGPQRDKGLLKRPQGNPLINFVEEGKIKLLE
jgi:hypothetical protein